MYQPQQACLKALRSSRKQLNAKCRQKQTYVTCEFCVIWFIVLLLLLFVIILSAFRLTNFITSHQNTISKKWSRIFVALFFTEVALLLLLPRANKREAPVDKKDKSKTMKLSWKRAVHPRLFDSWRVRLSESVSGREIFCRIVKVTKLKKFLLLRLCHTSHKESLKWKHCFILILF